MVGFPLPSGDHFFSHCLLLRHVLWIQRSNTRGMSLWLHVKLASGKIQSTVNWEQLWHLLNYSLGPLSLAHFLQALETENPGLYSDSIFWRPLNSKEILASYLNSSYFLSCKMGTIKAPTEKVIARVKWENPSKMPRTAPGRHGMHAVNICYYFYFSCCY